MEINSVRKNYLEKKIKDNRALQLSHEENIRNHLRINEDWFSHNINTLDFFFKENNLYEKKKLICLKLAVMKVIQVSFF